MDASIRKLFNDALDAIPLHEKVAYLEAVQHDPSLVMYETDPVEYLSFANMNVWEAATQLVKYWYWKKELFGERMILPIHDVSGTGALDADDLTTLRTGFLVRVPNDALGNAVVVFDRSRANYDIGTVDTTRILRMLFYATAAVTKEPDFSCLNRTVVAVNIVSGLPNTKVNIVRKLALILGCMPVRMQTIHNICMTTRVPILCFILKLVISLLEKCMIEFLNLLGTGVTFDLVATPDDAKSKLEQYGFCSEGLPHTLGGTWDYATFVEGLERKGLNCETRLADVVFNNSGLDFGGCPSTTYGGFVDLYDNDSVVQVPSNLDLSNNPIIPVTTTIYNNNTEIHPTTSKLLDDMSPFQPSVVVGMPMRPGSIPPRRSSSSPTESSVDQSFQMHSLDVSNNPLIPVTTTIYNNNTEIHSATSKKPGSIPPRRPSCISPTESSVDHSFQKHYLRYNNDDPLRTETQITSYKKVRQKLFAERSLLPMTQTGYGALNEEDVATLNTGFLMILPNDDSGNFVVTLEPCKVEGRLSESQRRCYFYILTVLFEQLTTTGNEKLVVLALLNNINTDNMNHVASFSDVGSCFPIDLIYLHVFLQPVGLGWFSYQSTAESVLKTLFDVPSDRIVTHILHNELDESFSVFYNIDLTKLPTCLGGKWTIENFKSWQQKRLQIENSILPTIPSTTGNPLLANVCTPADQSLIGGAVSRAPYATTTVNRHKPILLLEEPLLVPENGTLQTNSHYNPLLANVCTPADQRLIGGAVSTAPYATTTVNRHQPILLLEEPLLVPENGIHQTNSHYNSSLQHITDTQYVVTQCNNCLELDKIDALLECNTIGRDNDSTCFTISTQLFDDDDDDDDDISLNIWKDNIIGTPVSYVSEGTSPLFW